MKRLALLSLLTLLTLPCLAQSKVDKDKQNAKTEANSAHSKVMVTPSLSEVPNRKVVPANFKSMGEARKQMRRYRSPSRYQRYFPYQEGYVYPDNSDKHPNYIDSSRLRWDARKNRLVDPKHEPKYGEVKSPYPVDD